jgi:D-alanine-D-alanine ligase
MKVLLITGPAGASQGWGDMYTTELICDAIQSSGKDAEIQYVTRENDFLRAVTMKSFDLVWSALYHFSSNVSYIGCCQDELWVADILKEKHIPYVGPNARTMKNLIDKSATHRLLLEADIGVPGQDVVPVGGAVPSVTYPVFVKPCYESESSGISEESVVNSDLELEKRIKYIHETFKEPAVIEDYLPGKEFTVSVLGNGTYRKFYPVVNIIHPSAFKKYPVIVEGLKEKGLIELKIPNRGFEEAGALADRAAKILDCLDHVRIDMREDEFGNLKVIEVNGIPGLNPRKSRSLLIHSIYNSSQGNGFCSLINKIVEAARDRYGI